MELQQSLERARNNRKANQRFLRRLKQRPPKKLDDLAAKLHYSAFEEIDCLSCANCCRTTSPIVRDKDIDRLAKHLRLRPSELIEQHLRLDSEGDYVMNAAPCPFLGSDNYCSVYEARPKACREYPHTDRKNFHQILNLTLKNTMICPAALKVVEGLKQVLQ